MRTDSLLLFGSMLLSSILILASKPRTPKAVYTEKAIGSINQKFQNDLQQFAETTVDFNKAVINFEASGLSETSLQKSYRTLRVDFKKVEFVIEYLDKEAADKLLNGAPLPKLEQKVADLVVLQPKGMQVIDELMGVDDISDEIEKLSVMSEKLKTDVAQMQQYLRTKKITDRQFFEASRQAVVRLATLGITGFDTPGTTQGVSDTEIILTTLKDYFSNYKNELKNVGKTALLPEINSIFKKGIHQTKKEDFDSFNRLNFLTQVVNPLYKEILNIHLSLGYETIDEVTRYQPAVNYDSENIFDENFLNTFYYASISNDSTFNATAALGKLLFYDPILSDNGQMACASCHAPEKAFTDGLATSLSNTGSALQRNSMTLNYATYSAGFFHDMRTKRLEDQFEHVVLSNDEFNTDYQQIIEKLLQSDTYVSLFEAAFPTQKNSIVANNIDYALVAYVMKLNAFDSPVDKYLQGKSDELPENVQRGFNLFAGKAACATCHFMPLFSGTVPPLFVESESEVLGVPNSSETPLVLDDDIGRLSNGRTQEVADFWANSFKTPTVRNTAKTGPYMHNGVFETLEEVMDFYNEGGGAGRGIALEHQTLAPDPLNLTKQEIADIIAFMNALTDEKVFTAPDELPRDFGKASWNQRELVK